MQGASPPPWLAAVRDQLRCRNATQSDPFRTIFQRYGALVHRTQQLEKELKLTKLEARASLGASVGNLAAGGASEQEAQAQLTRLKEELTVCYKRLSENAASVLDLSNQLKAAEQRARATAEELEDARRRAAAADQRAAAAADELADKLLTVQVLAEELKALQGELVRADDRAARLAAENHELVARWVAKMNDEVARLNAANAADPHAPPGAGAAIAAASASPAAASAAAPAVAATGTGGAMPRHARRQWSAHKGEVTHVALGPLGPGGSLHVATAANDKTVRLWDISGPGPGAREAGTLTGAGSFVTHVAFSPDGTLLAAAANDNALRLWGLPGERVRHTLTGHLARVTAAAFAPDAARVYSASHDRTVKLWDLARGYCTRTLFALSACQDLLALPDGALLATAHHDGALRLWDARSPQLVRELAALHSKALTGLSTAGPGALVSVGRDHVLHVVDLRAMAVRVSAQHELFRVGLAWTRPAAAPDGAWLACGSHDGGVFLWSSGGSFAACLHAHKAPVAALAWHSARPQQLVSADNNATVVLWDAQP